MEEMDDAQFLTIVKNVVEQHGCILVDLDLENQVINIEGPEDAKAECALALGEILG